MKGYRVRLQRLVVTEIELNADTPGDAVAGALTAVLTGNYPDDNWVAAPLTPQTVKPLGVPLEIPLLNVTGKDAFTTEPEIPPEGLDLSAEILGEDEPPVPPDGLDVDDSEDAGPPIPPEGRDLTQEELAELQADDDDVEEL